MRKKNNSIIRVNDVVKIKIPRFVKRVGYPKSIEDYLAVIRQKHTTELDALFLKVSGHIERDTIMINRPPEASKQRKRVELELAYLMARTDGFGGKERSIHWVEKPEFAEVEMWVEGVRSVYTGTYFPPCSNRDYWTGDYDYEPGGLENIKCHRIAQVRQVRPVIRFDNAFVGPLTNDITFPNKRGLEIPVYHLEKLNA